MSLKQLQEENAKAVVYTIQYTEQIQILIAGRVFCNAKVLERSLPLHQASMLRYERLESLVRWAKGGFHLRE